MSRIPEGGLTRAEGAPSGPTCFGPLVLLTLLKRIDHSLSPGKVVCTPNEEGEGPLKCLGILKVLWYPPMYVPAPEADAMLQCTNYSQVTIEVALAV